MAEHLFNSREALGCILSATEQIQARRAEQCLVHSFTWAFSPSPVCRDRRSAGTEEGAAPKLCGTKQNMAAEGMSESGKA